jgi:hypothetical protein
MKQYIVHLPTGKDYQTILYRGSYITIKNGEIFNEDAPIRKTYPKMFIEYKPTEDKPTEDKPTVEEVIEPAQEKMSSTVDDFMEDDINNVENDDDVIIETT